MVRSFIRLKDIRINDRFWMPFMERVRTVVIPYQWDALNDRIRDAEPSYCMRNFKIAARLTHPEVGYDVDPALGHGGLVFQDSDVAKWIEAAAYTLVWHPDPELEKIIDGAIDVICSAQQDDGYLNTYYIIKGIENRFTNLKDNHELYCLGHFIEAAVAYYEATGKCRLLEAVIRYVDCVDEHIGPRPGQINGYDGHEIIEMALFKLYALTKEEKHHALARYFIDQRGKTPFFFKDNCEYYQAHKPVREQRGAVGHAVRALYLYSGMADAARLSDDKALFETCSVLWNNITQRQMYITGGVGQSVHGESFTFDYDLPNDTAYGETCAAIALAFFAQRMSAAAPKAEYGDVLERALYNGIISGISLDGKAFFYVNPLEVLPEACQKDKNLRHVKYERQKWFGCACCPPNLARIIASLGNYIYSVEGETLYTHLFIGGEANIGIAGRTISVKTETGYPWEDKVRFSFAIEGGTAEFIFALRIPGWCVDFRVTVNGETAAVEKKDEYAHIRRAWRDGEAVTVCFDMPVTVVEANPLVRQNAGRVAIQRGPIVYCMEEADNGSGLFKIRLEKDADFKMIQGRGPLEGIPLICCKGKKQKDWREDELYRPYMDGGYEDKELTFVPYYTWTNRGAGEMMVWGILHE
ncbi:MAG: glycoside hydrolase family 127 protein [Treponema sp.]|jgi:DUF1680 family protein|nr:glycoside hydrolase family 127 protein [Treponema sp.]